MKYFYRYDDREVSILCPKCGLNAWLPNWHGKVPCQAGCPEPFQKIHTRFNSELYGEDPYWTGMEHVLWLSPCGYRELVATGEEKKVKANFGERR